MPEAHAEPATTTPADIVAPPEGNVDIHIDPATLTEAPAAAADLLLTTSLTAQGDDLPVEPGNS